MSSRRDFLLSAAGSALAPAQSVSPKGDDSVSWGMPELIRSDIARFIDQYIRQPPKPRRANEDVFVSSNLENVFYVPMGSRAVLFDTGYDHQFDHHLENFAKLGCDVKKIAAILAS